MHKDHSYQTSSRSRISALKGSYLYQEECLLIQRALCGIVITKRSRNQTKGSLFWSRNAKITRARAHARRRPPFFGAVSFLFVSQRQFIEHAQLFAVSWPANEACVKERNKERKIKDIKSQVVVKKQSK